MKDGWRKFFLLKGLFLVAIAAVTVAAGQSAGTGGAQPERLRGPGAQATVPVDWSRAVVESTMKRYPNPADLAFYLARKRNVNDFHGLGAFLIMNEHFLTSASMMELTAPQKNTRDFTALMKEESARLAKPASVTVLGTPQASNATAGASVTGVAGTPPADAVKFIPSSEVHAAFEKGSPIVPRDGHNYYVTAGRRDKPGMAELHLKETDVFHVLQGTATFVTGGKIVEEKTIAPGEIRGSAIEGGESRALSKDDVIIIPAGVPHWFKDVQGLFLYYVVKVVQP